MHRILQNRIYNSQIEHSCTVFLVAGWVEGGGANRTLTSPHTFYLLTPTFRSAL